MLVAGCWWGKADGLPGDRWRQWGDDRESCYQIDEADEADQIENNGHGNGVLPRRVKVVSGEL